MSSEGLVAGVLHAYLPVIQSEGFTRDEIIEKYFVHGLNANEIVAFIVNVHGIRLNLRQLKKILKNRNCRRRKSPSNRNEVVQPVEDELKGSGSVVGYRAMHQRLINNRRLVVTREVVRYVLRILDPEGVNLRSKHRLRTRTYHAKGPNYLWHIDGYDKLKPFGFCTRGAIDGFSHRVLWLEVAY